MGTRGQTLHVRGLDAKRARTLVPKLGVDAVLLGVNDDWASIGFLAEVDAGELAKLVKKPVLQIWTDEDSGVSYQLFTPTGLELELTVPLPNGGYELSKGDAQWIEQAVSEDVLTASAAKKFREHLKAKNVEDWVLGQGAEALFGVPFRRPRPYPLLRELVPEGVEIIEAGAAKKSKAKAAAKKKKAAAAKATLPAATRAWTQRERAIVDLHFYYLTNVWSLNDWKIYNRYKKHLPPEYRFEVDRLVDLMMRELPREMRALLEAILDRVWDAEDWLAAIASDELARDLERDQRDAWRQRVAKLVRSLA